MTAQALLPVGYPLTTAADLAGVGPHTLRRWLYAGVFGSRMPKPGSGYPIRVPVDVVPIAKTLGDFQTAFGTRHVPNRVLFLIVDAYDDGTVTFGPITLTWQPLTSVEGP